MKLHKLLIIILFSLIIFFAIDSNSFASFTFNYNDETITLPDLPFDTVEHPDYVILYNYSGDYYQVGYPSTGYQTPFYYQTSKNSLGQGVQYWSSTDVTHVVVGPTSSNGLHWNYYDTTETTYSTWSSQKITKQNQLKTINNSPCAYIVYSSTDIINEDGTIFLKAGGINNNYNYNDYVLPELPDNLYKYNYIIKATVSSSEGNGTIYMLHSHSSPLEFYNGGCSSCQEDCSSDCPDGPISYCDHILSSGNVKVYTYVPSEYPSNDTWR